MGRMAEEFLGKLIVGVLSPATEALLAPRLSEALSAAYEQGAKDMRERAANVANFYRDDDSNRVSPVLVAAAIRTIPLTNTAGRTEG